MGVIATIEDALVTEVKGVLGATVKKVETLPGGWTHKSLQRALQFAPGVFVAFNGGRGGISDGYIDGRFSVYLVTKGPGEEERRRGSGRVIGVYEMVELLVPALSVFAVPEIGSAVVNGVDNLFRDAMFELGGTVYAINLTMPNMPFDFEPDITGLADFVLWHGEAYNEGGVVGGEDPLIIAEQKVNT